MARMDQGELAKAAGITGNTVRRLEAMEGRLRATTTTVDSLQRALEAAGVEFTTAAGRACGCASRPRPRDEQAPARGGSRGRGSTRSEAETRAWMTRTITAGTARVSRRKRRSLRTTAYPGHDRARCAGSPLHRPGRRQAQVRRPSNRAGVFLSRVAAIVDFLRAVDPNDRRGHCGIFAAGIGGLGDLKEGRSPSAWLDLDKRLRRTGGGRPPLPRGGPNPTGKRVGRAAKDDRGSMPEGRSPGRCARCLREEGVEDATPTSVRNWLKSFREGSAPAQAMEQYRTLLAGKLPPVDERLRGRPGDMPVQSSGIRAPVRRRQA